jgi:hypothetical protein
VRNVGKGYDVLCQDEHPVTVEEYALWRCTVDMVGALVKSLD